MRWLDEKLRTLGTAACPPYHLALVIGGTSAEMALKTAKLASARFLDTLPHDGNELRVVDFRDVELEQQVLALTQEFGIGAQFGGKYFCHDVRVIRPPTSRHVVPGWLAVSCSADRQALGKITAEGVFLEQLETDPAQYLPEVTHDDLEIETIVHIDLTRPMAEIRRTLSQYPVKTRIMLNGPMVVAHDIAHARSRSVSMRARECRSTCRTIACTTPGRRKHRWARRLVRSDHRGPDGLLRRSLPAQRWLLRDAREGEPLAGCNRRVP